MVMYPTMGAQVPGSSKGHPEPRGAPDGRAQLAAGLMRTRASIGFATGRAANERLLTGVQRALSEEACVHGHSSAFAWWVEAAGT